MALKKQSNWNFVARIAGLTGFLVAVAGLVLWGISANVARRDGGSTFTSVLGITLAVLGGVIAVATLVFEFRALSGLFTSRRGAFGSNVAVQVVLASLLLIGVNAFSFFHYRRYDWTRDRIFSEIRDKFGPELERLRSETSVVVLLRHVSFGREKGKQDNYDAAAERKIVEKTKDIVDQFREFGPRFRVDVLDIQDDEFEEKLADLRARSPDLAEAIAKAPENSVFFYAASGKEKEPGRVQRLSFHDIYQLDRVASAAANDKRGNLMLTYQGVEPFARKVLNIEEKKPHIAVAVVHEVLGLNGPELPGMPGALQTLNSRGFTAQDIILKTKWGRGAPEPSAVTHDEYKFDDLEQKLTRLDKTIKVRKEKIAEMQTEKSDWGPAKLSELRKKYVLARNVFGGVTPLERATAEEYKKAGRQLDLREINDPFRASYVEVLDEEMAAHEEILKKEAEKRDEFAAEQKNLNVENLAEQRRIADVRAKFNRMLAKADLLILPRLTLWDLPQGQRIANELHGLDTDQINAVKDFMKAGKPVLFCLGPTSEPANQPRPPQSDNDQLEDILADLGIRLTKDTVLYDAEMISFSQAEIPDFGGKVDTPPVKFEWEESQLTKLFEKTGKPHPIRESLAIASRSLGSDDTTSLRLRHPRPVELVPPKNGGKPAHQAVFMTSDRASWNESKPFADENDIPRFDPPKGFEKRGDPSEERTGPFPLAVALATKLPSTWYDSDAKSKDVRLAVIGSGGAFVGKNFSAMNEKLLLDTVNWLLGRDDLLSHKDLPAWQYPRVKLSPAQAALWQWGAIWVMPLTFVFMGCVMWMVRRTR